MSPALNGSSTLERFERSTVIEIRNGIMFDYYPIVQIITPSALKKYTVVLQETVCYGIIQPRSHAS